LKKPFKPEKLIFFQMKIKQINPAIFKSLSLEFQTYIDNNITGSVLCAIYHQGKLVYCDIFGWKDFFYQR